VTLHVELVDASDALNSDFKQRKKDSMPMGLVSHVGDILVHRVIFMTFYFAVFLTRYNNKCTVFPF